MLNKKYQAYLLGELLVVLIIMTFLSFIYLPKYPQIDYADYLFINDYLLYQSEAMKSYRQVDFIYDDLNSSFPIYFSKSGNVNQAQTIQGSKHPIIIHVGNGYLTYEK